MERAVREIFADPFPMRSLHSALPRRHAALPVECIRQRVQQNIRRWAACDVLGSRLRAGGIGRLNRGGLRSNSYTLK